MITAIEHRLIPAHILADDARASIARPLTLLAVLGFVSMLIYAILWALIRPDLSHRIIYPLAGVMVTAITLLFIRAGQLRRARDVLLPGTWLLISVTVLTAGGTRAPIFGLYIMIVLIAALLSGWSLASLYALVTALFGLGLSLYDPAGDRFPFIATPLSAWLTQLLTLIIVTGAAYLILRQREQTLERAQQEIQERTRTETALRESQSRLRIINNIAQSITALTDVETTLKRVLTELQNILPVDAFFIALHDPDTHTVTFPIMYDMGQYFEQTPGVLRKTGMVAQVIRTGETVLINRTPEDIQRMQDGPGRVGDTGQISASILMAPLPVGEDIIGVMSVQSYTLNSYDDTHRDLLVDAGFQIAIAINNARLYGSLQSELTERTRLEHELQRYNTRLELLVRERTGALQRANEQLELILNSTTDALAFARPNGDIMRMNPAFSQMFDAHVSRAIEGMLNAVVGEEQIEIACDAIMNVFYSSTLQQFETQIMTVDGMQRDVDLTLIPVEIDADEPGRGILISAHDITGLKEIERFKSRFVADAVHDLATPIAGLNTRLYLLKRNPEKLTDHVRALENQVQHLRTLLEDLRTISRIDRGKVELNKMPSDLNTIVQRVFDTYEPVAIEKSQTLIMSRDDTLPGVMIDSVQIERCLVNLVSNAINYTPENKEITIETAQIQDRVLITVQDQGIGISAQDQANIFERFFRSDDARDRVATGTGLGLAITKEIVALHGGTVSVSSQINQGSTFTIALPLRQA